MELYQLKTFMQIAQTGNLTEAAAQLNTSQPAASAHLKTLESEVGFILFHRTSKGMILTDKGAKLLPLAQKVISSMDEFHHAASELAGTAIDNIRIGLNTDGQLLQVGTLIESISERLPQVELHFINTKSEDFIPDVTSSKINAGYYYGNAAHPSIQSIKLHSFRMAVVFPGSWDIPEQGLSLGFFADKPWIWTTQGCPFYSQSIEYFVGQDIIPRKIMYVDDEALIGKLVQDEVGCSLLAEPVAMRFARDNMLQIWQGIDLYIDLYFGYPKDQKSDPVLSEIASIVEGMWK
ncbi:LysR family transcriptional regulator [Paenibacillus sp. sgz500958]|uniref:LysR family transcriptional regulator n=1 Tax=Paenibacillus sp. sgz500958 TaxID=3242475 RepID=UPI0036D409F2